MGHYARGTIEVQPGGWLAAGDHLVVGASSGATGLVTVTGGTVTAPEVIVGLTNGRGTFNLTNGSVTVSNLLVGLYASGIGVVNVAGGTLTATNGVMRIGPVGSGRMNISGGTTTVRELRLGGSTNGAEGVVRLLGGRLRVLSLLSVNAFDGGGGDLDGSGGTVIIGEGHNATMTISGATVTNIGTFYLGYSGGYTGTFTQDGGAVYVLTNVLVGDCASGAVGNMTLDAGAAFYALNPDQPAEFNVRNGTVVLNPGAVLSVDRLVITNACARFLDNGGSLSATTMVLGPDLARVLRELHATLKPGGVLFSSNLHGHNEEGWSSGRFGAFHDLDRWRRYVSAAGFVELTHYFRPAGLPRERQPWLASVWRSPA